MVTFVSTARGDRLRHGLFRLCIAAPLIGVALTAGCRSPYHADRGAAVGGLGGAAVGSVVGAHNGNPLAGAVVGGALGALTGAVIGEGLDEVEARNQAAIEASLGRQIQGTTTFGDVVTMSQAGLGDDVIVTQIRHHGLERLPSSTDLVALKQQGVSDPVLKAMQTPPPQQVMAAQPVAPVIVEEHYYGYGPRWCPPPRAFYYHHHHRRPRTSWGIAISN